MPVWREKPGQVGYIIEKAASAADFFRFEPEYATVRKITGLNRYSVFHKLRKRRFSP
jgi:hypothetical protein